MNNRSLPPCLRNFIVAAQLEGVRMHAICEELPEEFWPPWVDDGLAHAVRLVFNPAAPGLMSTVPPTGGDVVREVA